MATELTVVPHITFHLGAYTCPGYAYPLLQLQHPDLFTIDFFERGIASPVTVQDYADFIVEQALKRNQASVHVGHSAGAVALWLAGAKLAELGKATLLQGMVLMHPANIGPGESRLWNIRNKTPYQTFAEIGYFSQQAFDTIIDSQHAAKRKIKTAYKNAGQPPPSVRFRMETWSLIISALDGSACPHSTFPRKRVTVLKGKKDTVTTPNMVDETIKNIGAGIHVLEKKLDHSTPLKDHKGKILAACLKPLGYRLPN